ncbi:monovalent cation/H(+) antiporter subunit G [Vreelandella rituensis]|uniref:Na+/H+ antiporter subunit G n=1 Tax=Vreelandella rituensis TaxID=2282306 RepID=A0A368U695_9GAMM|nr:monovalent cation/H(+) antiporter subunit G [Halomonas rituensis]RCV92401.1 Na+/H+ antiporter subunit G [Halomonas rituensis]
MRELLAAGLILLGLPFFIASTLGLLRFHDVYARLHALTKADNVGLGLICLGLALQASSLAVALKILLIWGLILLASSTGATLISTSALQHGPSPLRLDDRDPDAGR